MMKVDLDCAINILSSLDIYNDFPTTYKTIIRFTSTCQFFYQEEIRSKIMKRLIDKTDTEGLLRISKLAIEVNDLETIKFILETGDQNVLNYGIDWASRSNSIEVIKYLHSQNGLHSLNSIEWASRFGHLEAVIYLIEEYGYSPSDAMFNAVSFGHLRLVKYLVRCENIDSMVSFAIDCGQSDIAWILIKEGQSYTCSDLIRFLRLKKIKITSKMKQRKSSFFTIGGVLLIMLMNPLPFCGFFHLEDSRSILS